MITAHYMVSIGWPAPAPEPGSMADIRRLALDLYVHPNKRDRVVEQLRAGCLEIGRDADHAVRDLDAEVELVRREVKRRPWSGE